MTWVLIVGLIMLAIALPIVGRRVWFLYRLITSGQPAPDRIKGVTSRVGTTVRNQLVEVFGQRRLLKWTIPGTAHFFVFWAFVILATVYLEAFGILFSRNPEWAIPIVGHWDLLGFAQDFIAVMCLLGIIAFWRIRIVNAPDKLGRQSRFKGSHNTGAYLVLFMIFNVIWTMFLFRGAAAATGHLPYGWGAFVSQSIGAILNGLPEAALVSLEHVGLLLHVGVMLVFLIDVVHSKHLHIFLAPINVAFKREPIALGAVKPLTSAGKPMTLDDLEDMDEDTKLGVGSIEDFSWKGMLDFASCTECGRCQSQCPAWNTEKPLSPKMLIMNLRDHAFAKGPYTLSDDKDPADYEGALLTELGRPLVGETEGDPTDPTGGGVIDPDVLWSCVSCGACVQQCPVDIEHVDHIVDMRRYQVLVESNFPAELNQLFKGLEGKGNPWNMSPNMRMDWAKPLDFDVPVVGEDLESLESVDWLFWVGCAGAYEDRAMKTTRAVAELLNIAGVSFGVLGKGETCTGDSARRAGNEFVFQGLAQQNVETFKEYKVKQVVSTCAHCFNTLKNEYKEFGIELEVVHHTQLLNRLVREGKLTPIKEGEGAQKRSITYHDPCFIGRHNQVYEPPRELLTILPGAEVVEMERNSEKSFCCGAGGARMWMEETIGSRINVNRTTEAVGTGADQIAVGCPFCRVMLSDGLTALQDTGEARDEVEVLDVAQMLLASVKGVPATRTKPGASARQSNGAGAGAAGATATLTADPAPVSSESAPVSSESAPVSPESGGGSLFDMGGDSPDPDDSAKVESPEGSNTKQEGDLGGGSLFDVGDTHTEATPDETDAQTAADTSAQADDVDLGSSGSLFDVGGAEPAAGTSPEPTTGSSDQPSDTASAPGSEIPQGGSLFDIGAPAEEPQAAPQSATAATAPENPPEDPPAPTADAVPESAPAGPEPGSEIPDGGSLFDIAAPATETLASSPPAAPQPATPEPATDSRVAQDTTAAPAEAENAAPQAVGVSGPEPGTEIPDGGSLFDIAAPAEESPAPAHPDTSDVASAEPAVAQPEPVEPSGSDVHEPALPEPPTEEAANEAQATADSGETDADSTGTDADSGETDADSGETDADSAGTDADSGETDADSAGHEPRTDVDISESSSLFDL